MKTFVQYIGIAALIVTMAACNELDNYDAPSKKFTGRIVYNGEAVNVEKGQVRIQLWESGWELKAPIDVAIEPDGTFSALLFNGDYKAVIPKGQGPFLTNINNDTQSDTIIVNLRGDTEMDISVTPYYVLKNTTFNLSAMEVNADFGIDKIVTDLNAKDIEYVRLFINKTQFVSNGNNIRAESINGGDIVDLNNISLSVEIPSMTPAQSFVYARVGVKVVGVEDMIFTSVQKIEF